jgi:hypothetical protein
MYKNMYNKQTKKNICAKNRFLLKYMMEVIIYKIILKVKMLIYVFLIKDCFYTWIKINNYI